MKTLLPEINSADNRFHNGDPSTGEQGTRVTDTWLNDVQDRVRDVQAEAHYVLTKAGFTPKNEQQTQLYQAIVKIIDDNRKSASTTQKGEVRLTSDTGLDSEELGLTARAGKKLAQMIATVQLALNNYIPLSKRSSAVNSNDENNVATSKAVKTAFDKGVEAKTAADAAQRTANDGVAKATVAQTSANTANKKADSANDNANGRVSKNGDTITGDLRINSTNNGWSKLQLGTTKGLWELEVNPNSHNENDRRFNMKYNGDHVVYLAFPTIGNNGEIAAYRSWVENRNTPWNKIKDKPEFATRWPNAVEQGYSHSLGRTGWTKLPSGLIMQWGEVNGLGVHKFPLAFNQVGQVFVCDRSYSDDAEVLVVREMNNTSFRVWSRNNMGAFLFFAIGS